MVRDCEVSCGMRYNCILLYDNIARYHVACATTVQYCMTIIQTKNQYCLQIFFILIFYASPSRFRVTSGSGSWQLLLRGFSCGSHLLPRLIGWTNNLVPSAIIALCHKQPSPSTIIALCTNNLVQYHHSTLPQTTWSQYLPSTLHKQPGPSTIIAICHKQLAIALCHKQSGPVPS